MRKVDWCMLLPSLQNFSSPPTSTGSCIACAIALCCTWLKEASPQKPTFLSSAHTMLDLQSVVINFGRLLNGASPQSTKWLHSRARLAGPVYNPCTHLVSSISSCMVIAIVLLRTWTKLEMKTDYMLGMQHSKVLSNSCILNCNFEPHKTEC